MDDLRASLTSERELARAYSHLILLAHGSIQREGRVPAEIYSQMAEVEGQLSPESQEFLSQLSGDAYALFGKEVRFPSGEFRLQGDPLPSLQAALRRYDWPDVLNWLRTTDLGLDRIAVSLMRGRAFTAMGLPEAGSAFYNFAVSLEPARQATWSSYLDSLIRAGQIEQFHDVERSLPFSKEETPWLDALVELGQPERTPQQPIRLLEHASRLSGSVPAAVLGHLYLRAGEILMKGAREGDAARCWAAAHVIDPGDWTIPDVGMVRNEEGVDEAVRRETARVLLAA